MENRTVRSVLGGWQTHVGETPVGPVLPTAPDVWRWQALSLPNHSPFAAVRLGLVTSMEWARIDAVATMTGNAAGHSWHVQHGLRPVSSTMQALSAWM